MTTAWRVVKTRYAATAFDGEGARLYGGRWNSPGTRVVYAAESVALALLEIVLHARSTDLLASYSLFSVRFDDALVQAVSPESLPHGWRAFPPLPSTQAIGDAWAHHGASAVLRVPSVTFDQECHYLLNPAHRDFPGIALGEPRQLVVDPRLLAAFRGKARGT
jgi:RES domain-containing protein